MIFLHCYNLQKIYMNLQRLARRVSCRLPLLQADDNCLLKIHKEPSSNWYLKILARSLLLNHFQKLSFEK